MCLEELKSLHNSLCKAPSQESWRENKHVKISSKIRNWVKCVMSVSKSRLSTHLITYPVHGDNAKSHKLSELLVHQGNGTRWQFMAPSCQELKEWNHRRPLVLLQTCFSSSVLESKLGGLTVYNASHLSLLSKCKISQCQLGQSPTRVGGASYQAPLAQLPPPACSHPCTQWRINKTSPTLWGPACCVIGKLKSEMS